MPLVNNKTERKPVPTTTRKSIADHLSSCGQDLILLFNAVESRLKDNYITIDGMIAGIDKHVEQIERLKKILIQLKEENNS